MAFVHVEQSLTGQFRNGSKWVKISWMSVMYSTYNIESNIYLFYKCQLLG